MVLMSNCPTGCISGFDNFAEEVGISRDSSLKKDMSLDVEFDEKDRMKVSKIVFQNTQRKMVNLSQNKTKLTK